MSGRDDAWAAAVSAWAGGRPDIQALVQIGSRVQAGSVVDGWSDHDYHLVTSSPGNFTDGSFAHELGPCWAVGAQVAFGNAVKVTAVYDGALEADFVIVRHAELLVAMLAMRWPAAERWWPRPLREGVASLRIVAGPGWRVIKGGEAWERRYARIAPLQVPLSEREFQGLCGEFWTQLVWAAKKAARGEYRASLRTLHLHLVENCMRLLQEEALLAGRRSYPLGRRAEQWLSPSELLGTDVRAGADRASLLAALAQIADTFEKTSAAVAGRHGWTSSPPAAVRAWLAGLGATPT
jgi:hypothetical protein